MIWVFAVRFLGGEREVLVLKVNGQNFYAFPPYARTPQGNVDTHMSWHASGERHFVARCRNAGKWEESPEMKRDSTVMLQKPAKIRGVELLDKSGVFAGMFLGLRPVGTNEGELVVLDADGAGFVDDAFFLRAYLVEPGAEDQIPVGPGAGPRILHLIKRTHPWLAVEVFQQAR
jgi:hypothetical protein